jgi:hypothetical protein
MVLHRALMIAVCLLPAVPAAAQAPWPGEAQAPAASTAPWPGQPPAAQPQAWPSQPQAPVQAGPSPWTQAPQSQSEPPCMKEIVKLREDAQKKANAIQQASKHKPSAKEACNLFNAFYAAEARLIKFASANQSACGIPAQAVVSMKEQHTKTNGVRTNVCRAAAAGPPRPAGPSLSDALSAPITNSDNIKTGRGTFDTLTGSPLGK